MTTRPLLQIKLEFEDVDFCGGEKSEKAEKYPRRKDENQQLET